MVAAIAAVIITVVISIGGKVDTAFDTVDTAMPAGVFRAEALGAWLCPLLFCTTSNRALYFLGSRPQTFQTLGETNAHITQKLLD